MYNYSWPLNHRYIVDTPYTVAAIIIEMHLPVPLPVPVQFQSSYFQITMASIWTCPYGSHSYLEIPGLELDWNWKWNWQMHFNNYSCYCMWHLELFEPISLASFITLIFSIHHP